MPRVRLEEQPEYEFSHTITVRVTDVNYGGHLANDALVGLISEARVHLMRSLGISELNLGDGRTGIIIGDLVVNFTAEGFMFDVLQIDSHIDDLTSRSFRVYHRFTKASQLLALAETGLMTFDYVERRVVPIPENFLQALNEYKAHRSKKCICRKLA